MNRMHKVYLRDVQRWIPGNRKLKNRIMDSFKRNVESWLEDYPNCGYRKLEDQFGKPEQIAASYVENVNTDEILHSLQINKKILRLVAGALLAALVLWAAFAAVALVDAHKAQQGYSKITPVVMIVTED